MSMREMNREERRRRDMVSGLGSMWRCAMLLVSNNMWIYHTVRNAN